MLTRANFHVQCPALRLARAERPTARARGSSVPKLMAKGDDSSVDSSENDAGDFSVASSHVAENMKVVGCGGIGIDYLASVAAFPKPDEKLRTQALQVQGGGNAGNALTAAARLGLKPSLISKIGDDALGTQILEELQSDGIDTKNVLQAKGFPSPFTYIIVDREGGTRTCIHTPGEPLHPDEISEDLTKDLLEGAQLVYFDGRLTEGALLVAKAAKELGIPLLVEAERLRPKLEELLMMADYVTTSSHFPHDWTGEEHLGDAMLIMMSRLPNAKFITTTLGAKGSVMVFCSMDDSTQAAESELTEVVLQDYLDASFDQLAGSLPALSTAPVDAIGAGNVPIRSGIQLSSSAPMVLKLKRGVEDAEAAKRAALEAAQRAARNNADAANHRGYMGTACTVSSTDPNELVASVVVSSAAVIDRDAVFDTTGAGDAFLGSCLYGLVTGMSYVQMMKLAGLVSAANCTALGARLGLPQRTSLRPEVL